MYSHDSKPDKDELVSNGLLLQEKETSMSHLKHTSITRRITAFLGILVLSMSSVGIAQAKTVTISKQTVKDGSTVVATATGNLSVNYTSGASTSTYKSTLSHVVALKPTGNNHGTYSELKGSYLWRGSNGVLHTVSDLDRTNNHTVKKTYTDSMNVSLVRSTNNDGGHTAFVKICMDKAFAPDPCSAGASAYN